MIMKTAFFSSILLLSVMNARAEESITKPSTEELVDRYRSALDAAKGEISAGRPLPPALANPLRRAFTELIAAAPTAFVSQCRKEIDAPLRQSLSPENWKRFESQVDEVCGATKYDDLETTLRGLLKALYDSGPAVRKELTLEADLKTAQLDLKALRVAIEMYEVKNEKLPASLGDLIPNEMRRLRDDPWGNAYDYSLTEKECRVSSAGPDGKLGTADDLVEALQL